MNTRLIKLEEKYKDLLVEMMNEWIKVEKKFSPYAIRKNDYTNFRYYLDNLDVDYEIDGKAPNTTFFLLDMDKNKFIGAINIRHYLNEDNKISGGHIGYGVRPSERRKGYATNMLNLGLLECKKIGLEKVLLTCDQDNIGSIKTILKNGGVFESEVIEDGNIENRYWIRVK